MKKLFMLVLLISACSGLLWAQSAQTDQPEGTTSTTTTTTSKTTTTTPSLTGTIVSVDSKANSLTVMDPVTQKVTIYNFDKKTTFTRLDKPIKVLELKEGDKITFVSEDGTRISTVTISADTLAPPNK